VASETDIGNLSLGHLGEDSAVTSFDPPDGSVHAEHCARFYPMARDMCLEAHDWKFARRTVQLTETVAGGDDYAFVYALPADYLRAQRIYIQDWRRDLTGIDEFETETNDSGQMILMCDIENPYLIYTRRVDDTTKFSPSFTVALSYLLASMLAGPVIKGEAGQTANKYWFSVWRAYLAVGSTLDAGNQRANLDQWPSSIRARA
jgi:hypothetical protein